MTERLEIIYSELLEKCKASENYEFEYFWEIWGIMWHPWFIEINGVNQYFSMNDISINDINELLELGFIELVKVNDYPLLFKVIG